MENNDSNSALGRFTVKRAEIEVLILQMQVSINKRFNIKPEDVSWNDVCELTRYEQKIKELKEAMFGEGEPQNGRR